MLEDRLRPRYASKTSSSGLYRAEYSPRSKQTSPQQRKARAIVNKYRKNVRYAQLYRLKALVPAVKDKEEASEVNINLYISILKHFYQFEN